MNLKFTFLLVITAYLILGLPKNIQKKVDSEIKKTFQVVKFTFNPVIIQSKIAATLPAKFGKDNFFKIKETDSIIGYAYVAKAPSKTDVFDYLVLLDANLIIVKTKVLIYREDYGSEIGSKRWLKQFVGKTEHDNLKYQENIVAISGATISVKSMTNAVNNLLKSLKILHSKNSL